MRLIKVAIAPLFVFNTPQILLYYSGTLQQQILKPFNTLHPMKNLQFTKEIKASVQIAEEWGEHVNSGFVKGLEEVKRRSE